MPGPPFDARGDEAKMALWNTIREGFGLSKQSWEALLDGFNQVRVRPGPTIPFSSTTGLFNPGTGRGVAAASYGGIPAGTISPWTVPSMTLNNPQSGGGNIFIWPPPILPPRCIDGPDGLMHEDGTPCGPPGIKPPTLPCRFPPCPDQGSNNVGSGGNGTHPPWPWGPNGPTPPTTPPGGNPTGSGSGSRGTIGSGSGGGGGVGSGYCNTCVGAPVGGYDPGSVLTYPFEFPPETDCASSYCNSTDDLGNPLCTCYITPCSGGTHGSEGTCNDCYIAWSDCCFYPVDPVTGRSCQWKGPSAGCPFFSQVCCYVGGNVLTSQWPCLDCSCA